MAQGGGKGVGALLVVELLCFRPSPIASSGPHPLPPLLLADQMCLWCYHHILEEAAKASLPARCPNCRSEYDEEKIQMQHIDAEQ